MTFEEFEKADARRLREMTKDAFNRADTIRQGWAPDPSLLAESQFYLSEIERRHGSWIALRDLILEILVIALIGGEIWLGWQQGKDEGNLMDKQTGVLQKLDDSASSTAANQATMALTLKALQSTTEHMNDAIQGQLALFYDVSLNVLWVPATRRINVANNGRTNVTLWGFKLGTEPEVIETQPRVIIPNGGFELDFSTFYDQMNRALPQGVSSSPISISLALYLKNEKQDEFVLNETLVATRNGDTLAITTQTLSISPERWSHHPKPRRVAPGVH